MKYRFLILLLIITSHNLAAQQIQLCGVISVQNSRTQTGKVQYIKNAQVEHQSAKPTLTDDEGFFCLYIVGIKEGTQTSINVSFPLEYANYDIVNKNEVEDLTLGRKEPIRIFVCQKGELEKRRALMIDVNISKYQENANKDIARLEKEKQTLYTQLKFSNERLVAIEDSLRIINDRKVTVYEQIRLFSEVLVKENLDDKEEVFINAYNCFARGELDSVQYYLSDSVIENNYQDVIMQFTEGEELINLGRLMQERANEKLTEIIDSWMLRAEAYNIQNKHDEAFCYYEKAVNADTLNFYNLLSFANYLYKQNNYILSDYYYWKCYTLYEKLSDYQKEEYEEDLATVFHGLGLICKKLRNYTDSEYYFLKSLDVYTRLGKNINIVDIQQDLGDLYWYMNLFDEAIACFLKSIDLSRNLDKSYDYYEYLMINYNSIAYLLHQKHNFLKAEEYLTLSLQAYDSLEVFGPGTSQKHLSATYRNLAILNKSLGKSSEAVEYYKKSYSILYKLNLLNPQAFESELSLELYNLGLIETELNNFNEALKYLKESKDIRDKLTHVDSLANLDELASIYYGLGWVYQNIGALDSAKYWYLASFTLYEMIDGYYPLYNEMPYCAILGNKLGSIYQDEFNYDSAFLYYFWVNDILSKLTKYNLSLYGVHSAHNLEDIASCYLKIEDYSKAIKYYNKSLRIWRNLSGGKNPIDSYYHGNYIKCLKTLIDLTGDLDKSKLSRKYEKEFNNINRL